VSLGNVLAVQLIPGNDLLPTSSIRARPVMRKMSASTSVSTKWMGGFLCLLGSQSPPVQQLPFPTRNRANTGASGKKIPTDKGWDLNIGLGSIERSLKNHVNKGFFNFQRNFVPPFVPPFCLCYLENLSLDYLMLFYLELDLPKDGLHNPRQIAS